MANNELRITMLGPRGVGKTTLLASMYNEFDKTVTNINLTLTPSQATSSSLQQRLAELKSQTEVFSATGGIDGTNTPKNFDFELGMIGKQPELKLIFNDFPGGYIHDNPAQVQKYLDESDVIMLVIDTPAVMESKGIWHERINAPQTITDLFKRVTRNLTKTKLLLLVPVKCESYVQTDREAREMLTRLKDSYDPLLNLLKSDAVNGQIAVAFTPVQTLGVVRFARIEMMLQGEPRFFFRKISPNAVYSPQDVDQILRYTLGFSIKKYLDDMPTLTKWFKSIFKMTKPFEDAIRKLAGSERKETKGGFEILQGNDLLNIKH
jgi:GTPase SAR1 family protein